MYTITIFHKHENEQTMINVPNEMVALDLGNELAISKGDIEKVYITLDQSYKYVKSSIVYLTLKNRSAFDYGHSLTPFDWRNN